MSWGTTVNIQITSGAGGRPLRFYIWLLYLGSFIFFGTQVAPVGEGITSWRAWRPVEDPVFSGERSVCVGWGTLATLSTYLFFLLITCLNFRTAKLSPGY
jgi:hypothetical protein